MRFREGPPEGDRPFPEHVSYSCLIEACPPPPGVVPGLFKAPLGAGPSMTDRRRAAQLARVREARDADLNAELTAIKEEKGQRERAVAAGGAPAAGATCLTATLTPPSAATPDIADAENNDDNDDDDYDDTAAAAAGDAMPE